MQAVILAGGKGTRLKPYTVVFPKPLMPLGDRPILDIVIRQLIASGVDHVTISTGHLAELIETYFGDGTRFGVKIEYVREEVPLNTAGALRLVRSSDENFLVMNGDVLTNLDFRRLYQDHCKSGVAATIATRIRESKIDFGVVETDATGFLTGYREKPVYTFPVSMGVYVLNRKCKELIHPSESIGMPDLLLRLIHRGEKVFCFESDAYWLDIGRVDDYEQAQQEFETNKESFVADHGQ